MNGYSIIEPIGEGAYGQVKRAMCKASGDTVAIKILKRRYRSWTDCSRLGEFRVFSDIHQARNLKHPNLVTIRQAILQNEKLVFVFDYMPQNLHQLMTERKDPFPDDEVQVIIKQILRGLEFIHTHGYFHRDLKPENVLCDGIHNIKIADLGQARRIRSRPPYTDYVATRWYRAPEVLLHSLNYSSPVDIWALGAIMGELYTLRPLFKGSCQIDQLFLISCLIGTPKSSEWLEGFLLASSIGFKWNPRDPQDFTTAFPEASEESRALLQSVLVWNPIKRPSASHCLRILGESSCGGAQPGNSGEGGRNEVGLLNLHFDKDSKQINYSYVQGQAGLSTLGQEYASTCVSGKRLCRRTSSNLDTDSENSSYEDEVETYINTLKEKLNQHNSRSAERLRMRQLQAEMAAHRRSKGNLEAARQANRVLLERFNKANQAALTRAQNEEVIPDSTENTPRESSDSQPQKKTTRLKRNRSKIHRRQDDVCIIRVPYPPFSPTSSPVSSWGDTPPSSRGRSSRQGSPQTQSEWNGTEKLYLVDSFDDNTYVTPWNEPARDRKEGRANVPHLLDDLAARDEETDDDDDYEDAEEDDNKKIDSGVSDGLNGEIDDLIQDIDDQLNANPKTPPRARRTTKGLMSGKRPKQEENNKNITAVFSQNPSFIAQVSSRPRVKKKDKNTITLPGEYDNLLGDMEDDENSNLQARLPKPTPKERPRVDIDDEELDRLLSDLDIGNSSESDATIENESADESNDDKRNDFPQSGISRLLADLAKERQARDCQK